jgi:hypothetical protein
MSEFSDEVKGVFGNRWGKIIVGFLGVVFIYIAFSAVFHMFPFSLASKVVNTNSIIQNYEWYYSQYNTIQAMEANIASLKADASERSGMMMVMNNAIAEYNSRTRMMTRNMWKPQDLPYQIDLGGSK